MQCNFVQLWRSNYAKAQLSLKFSCNFQFGNFDKFSNMWRHGRRKMECRCWSYIERPKQVWSSTLCLIGWCNRIEDEASNGRSTRIMKERLGRMNSLFTLKAIRPAPNVEYTSDERTWMLSTYLHLDPLPISWKGAPDGTYLPQKIPGALSLWRK